MSKIKILLVDDHTILRLGLRSYLRYASDFEVVGEASNGIEALAQVERLCPDVVLMDIAMPEMNGIDATRLIRERYPKTNVLILSQYSDPQYVLPLLRAGAAGFIMKDVLGTDLLAALQAVAAGKIYLCPSIAGLVVEELCSPNVSRSENRDALTPRELEILRCIASGQTNPQIAEELSISVNTVEWHRANLMNKLDVHTAGELVHYAMQHGLVENVLS